MRRTHVVLGGLLVLLAPFHEGGRGPLGLLALHTLAVALALYAALARRAPGASIAALEARTGVTVLVAIGMLLALASGLRAAYPLASGLALMDLLAGAAVFAAAAWIGAAVPHVARLRDLLVASSTLQGVIAAVRWVDGGAAGAASGFLNPNHLAAFLNIGMLCALAEALAGETIGSRRRIAWGTLAALHLVMIVALASRGALLGMLVSGLVLVGGRWRSWRPAARLAAGVTALLAVSLAAGALAQRFGRFDDPFRYQRLGIWRASLEMLAARPLLGYGPGMFRHVSARHNFPIEAGPVRYGRAFGGAHNGYLTLAVEAGAPAAACLAGAALIAAMALRRRSRQAPLAPAGAATEGFALALFALLAQAAVEDLQERPAIVLIMALAAGLAMRPPRDQEAEGLAIPAPSPATTWALARCGAALLAICLWWAGVAAPYLADREARAGRRAGREGIARMERAARLNPFHPEYQHDLAMAQLNAGPIDAERYAEAAQRLERACQLKPIDYRFPLLRARLEGQFAGALFDDATASARAAGLYAEAARLAPLDPRPALEQAAQLAEHGRAPEALAALAAALLTEPHFRRARLLQIALLIDLGRLSAAREALESLRRTDEVLSSYRPESGYAADLVRDVPEERGRIAAALRGVADHP